MGGVVLLSESKPAILEIKRVSDGEIRQGSKPEPWYEHSDFVWGEGNYCCDCNRGDFFASMGKEKDPDTECSHGLFSVRLKDAATGAVLYQDGEWPDEASSV